MKTRNIIIAIIVLGLLSFVSILAYRIISKSMNSAKPQLKITYSVGSTILKKQKVEEYIGFRGLVEGDPQIKLYTSVGGKFIANLKQEGDSVVSGDTVVQIDRDLVGQNFQPVSVISPIAGIVKKLYFVDRGASITPDRPIAEIANTGSLKVMLNVGEGDLQVIKTGMLARLNPVIDKNTVIPGIVFSVTPFIDTDTLAGSIIVKASNPGNIIKLGMSVDVKIKSGDITGFFLPPDAVLLDMLSAYVFINDKGIAKRINVDQGYTTADLVEIRSTDLKEGIEIVTDGSFKLTEGASLKILEASRDKPEGTALKQKDEQASAVPSSDISKKR
jgi:multidrug efflux pump subunit AcrA (membrane-fusion protein)